MKLKTNILFKSFIMRHLCHCTKPETRYPASLRYSRTGLCHSVHENDSQCSPDGHQKPYPPHSVLTDGTHTAELPQILLNGERAHRLYRRTLALNKRRGKADVTPVFTAIPLTDSDQTIHYRASLPAADWIQFATRTSRRKSSTAAERNTKRKYPHSGHSTPYSNSNRSFRSPTGQEPGKLLWQQPPPLLPLFRNTVLFPLLRPHPLPNRISREAMYLPKAMPPMSATRKS